MYQKSNFRVRMSHPGLVLRYFSHGFRFRQRRICLWQKKRVRLRLRIVYREVIVVYSSRTCGTHRIKTKDETDTWPKPKPITDKQINRLKQQIHQICKDLEF
jgi:hypothetical protein